jgi:hypothetical protein
MANKLNPHELKLIIKSGLKTKVSVLLDDTRTHTVKSERILLDDLSQQDSIIYAWYFKTSDALESKRVDVANRLGSNYITDYIMVVT